VEQLVEQGVLQRRTSIDGTVLYRMSPARIKELQRMFWEYKGSGEETADEG
jgi:hypothetical protein